MGQINMKVNLHKLILCVIVLKMTCKLAIKMSERMIVNFLVLANCMW